MNKKKGLLVLAVVLLCGVGIAFAALSDSLKINGSASAIAADFKLEFKTDAVVTPIITPESSTDMQLVAPTYTDANKTATIKVTGLKHAGDTIAVPLMIVNKGEVKASINDAIKTVDNPNGDFELVEGDAQAPLAPNYEVTVDMDNNEIPANKDAEVLVTVKLVKPFIDATEAAKERPFTITITGHAVEDTPAA